MSDDSADHWDAVFASRDLDAVSWFEKTPAHSVELLRQQPGSVIDIGAGASRLPDALLAEGREDITLLDISQEALAVTRERLGSADGRVAYVVSDVLAWEPSRTYDVWHDRAVFHFLTEPANQAAYVDLAARTLSPGPGHIRPRRTHVLLRPANGPPLSRRPRRPPHTRLHPHPRRNPDPPRPRRGRATVHLGHRAAHQLAPLARSLARGGLETRRRRGRRGRRASQPAP